MNYFSKKVVIPKPFNGEYIVTVKEHKDMSDEKGNRYLMVLNIDGRTYDYYIFPSENDYELDEKGNLKKSQVNYLLSVFSRITGAPDETDLVTLLDVLKKAEVKFIANISYNEEYNRNNVSFYPVRETEEAPDL